MFHFLERRRCLETREKLKRFSLRRALNCSRTETTVRKKPIMTSNKADQKTENDSKIEGGEFQCQMCGLKEKYYYFGRKPKFAPSYVFLEDVYLAIDPFSSQLAQKSFLLLGSNCSVCNATICQSSGCSLFFAKWVCLKCAKINQFSFPTEIQQEIMKRCQ